MNNEFVNLNTVTLYKTPLFSMTDSVLFANEYERDLYFGSITDKLELTEFTDLYEGRQIVLPYNYLDLKLYNTMKLHYDDGLGHIYDYYCNVDNYIYTSTNSCVPIYRIDYFLTYGHLLYDKDIDVIVDRRTVPENEINNNMKSDAIVVPKLKYTKKRTWSDIIENNYNESKEYYIIYLNNITDKTKGKRGITASFVLPIGKDIGNNFVNVKLDDFTIGCYVVVCGADALNTVLDNEPAEYIEKITKSNVPPKSYGVSVIESTDVVYVNSDLTIGANAYEYEFIKKSIYTTSIYTSEEKQVNLYPNHDKKIMKRLPTFGYVVQGQEFDLKDFRDDDFPQDESVVDNTTFTESSLYFYNCFDYTFVFPIGYRGESVNMGYMVKWQSAKNFSYTSDYTKSLAYKQIQEENNQAIINANRVAGVQSYYANLIAQNANQQLDVSKSLTTASYLSQVNTLDTTYAQTLLNGNQAIRELNVNNSWQFNLLGKIGGLFTGGTVKDIALYNSQQITNQSVLASNLNSLTLQKDVLKQQRDLQYQSIDIQKQANLLNARYQCDTASVARDNAIANISIKNKYNNCQPNAYNPTDYTQFTSYYYEMEIETYNETDFSIVDNVRNHYNVLGVSVGYLEKWQPKVKKGLYFNYILGSVVDNSNKLIKEIPSEIFIELISRIEQGIRLWYVEQLDWFGNLTIDNTYTGSPEIYNELSDTDKKDILYFINSNMYDYNKTDLISLINSNYNGEKLNYALWYINDLPYGENELNEETQTKLQSLALLIKFYGYDYYGVETLEDGIKLIKDRFNWLTINEKVYCINILESYYTEESEE